MIGAFPHGPRAARLTASDGAFIGVATLHGDRAPDVIAWRGRTFVRDAVDRLVADYREAIISLLPPNAIDIGAEATGGSPC